MCNVCKFFKIIFVRIWACFLSVLKNETWFITLFLYCIEKDVTKNNHCQEPFLFHQKEMILNFPDCWRFLNLLSLWSQDICWWPGLTSKVLVFTFSFKSKEVCLISSFSIHFWTYIKWVPHDPWQSLLCPVSWGCRIHWLQLCRGVRPPPTSVLDMTLNNLMVRFQQCWSFGECRVPLHCHRSQVHSGLEW